MWRFEKWLGTGLGLDVRPPSFVKASIFNSLGMLSILSTLRPQGLSIAPHRGRTACFAALDSPRKRLRGEVETTERIDVPDCNRRWSAGRPRTGAHEARVRALAQKGDDSCGHGDRGAGAARTGGSFEDSHLCFG